MKNIFKQLKRYWYIYTIAVTFLVIAIALDMLAPVMIQRIIDEVIIDGKMQKLMRYLLIILFIGIGRGFFQYYKEYLFDWAGVRVSRNMRKGLLSHIETLSLRFFHENTTGELMARVKDDVDRVWDSIGFVGMILIEAVIHCCFVLYCMFRISPWLTLIPLAITPIVGYIAVKMENQLGTVYESISEKNAELTTVAQENLAGVRTVKSFAREKHEIKKFLDHNQVYYDLNVKQANIVAKYYPIIQFLTKVLLIMVIVFGGLLVMNNNITLGQLGAFTEYANNIVWPMEILGWIANSIAAAVASNKKLKKLHAETPDIHDPEQPVEKENIEGIIEFKDVSFSIDDTQILHHINFKLDKGKTIGIMGSTGSGKSSIVNLIERFYDVDSGEILMDGENIKNYPLKQLRRAISIVMQDVFLFSDTIEENMKIGIDEEEVNYHHMKKAAEYASAKAFINSLSKKYKTVIGERGVGLSGGQKQRISIARALMKQAPVLIFDDSTSALDMETEYQIQSSLEKISDVSKLIIAHRISAVKDADEIIILEKGEIAERGTHHELLQKKGLYYQTYLAQYGSYGLDEEVISCP